jgi:hypothetical protein
MANLPIISQNMEIQQTFKHMLFAGEVIATVFSAKYARQA